MLRKLVLILLVSTLALSVFPAQAQDTEGDAPEDAPERGAWGIFAGFLQGSELTNNQIFGSVARPLASRPELDDGATFGAIYSIQTAPRWILETRIGLSSTTVLDAPDLTDPGVNPPRMVDAQLFYLDIALIPTFTWGEFTLGIPFGGGWGSVSADEVIAPFIPGRSIELKLEGGNGAQYFAGLQGRWRTGGRWSLFADARIHRFHRLVNVTEQNVNAPEITFGFLRHF